MIDNCFFLGHPFGFTESHSRVLGGGAQFFFDTKQLVVLGCSFSTARSSGLDLSGAESDGQVGNVIVFGFPGTVRSHDTPTILLGKFDGIDGFGNGSDLVDLKQQTVGGLLFDGLLDFDGVGDGQVISDNLDLVSNFGDNLGPVLPVILVEGVFDSDNGVFVNEFFVKGNHFVTRQDGGSVLVRTGRLEIEVIGILVLDLEFGTGDIQTDGNLIGVSSSFGSFHNHLQARFHVARRSETSFISNKGGISSEFGLDDFFEVVKDFASDNHGFGKVGSACGNDKEFLKGEFVSGVFSSVNDVETWDRESVGDGVSSNVGIMFPERNATSSGSGLSDGQGD